MQTMPAYISEDSYPITTLSDFAKYVIECDPDDYSTETIEFRNKTYKGKMFGNFDFEFYDYHFFQIFYTDSRIYKVNYQNPSESEMGIDTDSVDWTHPIGMEYITFAVDDTESLNCNNDN